MAISRKLKWSYQVCVKIGTKYQVYAFYLLLLDACVLSEIGGQQYVGQVEKTATKQHNIISPFTCFWIKCVEWLACWIEMGKSWCNLAGKVQETINDLNVQTLVLEENILVEYESKCLVSTFLQCNNVSPLTQWIISSYSMF